MRGEKKKLRETNKKSQFTKNGKRGNGSKNNEN